MRNYCEGWRVEVTVVIGNHVEVVVNDIECFRRGNIWEVYDNKAGMLFTDSDCIGADNAIKHRIKALIETAEACGFKYIVTRIK